MRLSIALCTYNGARFLPAQLASFTEQSRQPDELVIRDDCSTDDTAEIVRHFAATAPFHVDWQINASTLGSTKNFETAIRACTGDVIFLCDQDDVWAKEKLEKFAVVFQASPRVGLVASDLDVVGDDLRPLGYRMWETLPFPPAARRRMEAGGGWRQLLRYNVVTGAAAAFRASLRDMILPIPKSWVHDGWIAFLASTLCEVKFLAEPLTRYRRHGSQQIGTQPLTLSRQITFARLRDSKYFEKLADGFDALGDHLETMKGQLLDPAVVAAVRDRAAHARVQQIMREGPRVRRVLPAVRELTRGRYHRYGHGLKGFAADLFL